MLTTPDKKKKQPGRPKTNNILPVNYEPRGYVKNWNDIVFPDYEESSPPEIFCSIINPLELKKPWTLFKNYKIEYITFIFDENGFYMTSHSNPNETDIIQFYPANVLDTYYVQRKTIIHINKLTHDLIIGTFKNASYMKFFISSSNKDGTKKNSINIMTYDSAGNRINSIENGLYVQINDNDSPMQTFLPMSGIKTQSQLDKGYIFWSKSLPIAQNLIKREHQKRSLQEYYDPAPQGIKGFQSYRLPNETQAQYYDRMVSHIDEWGKHPDFKKTPKDTILKEITPFINSTDSLMEAITGYIFSNTENKKPSELVARITKYLLNYTSNENAQEMIPNVTMRMEIASSNNFINALNEVYAGSKLVPSSKQIKNCIRDTKYTDNEYTVSYDRYLENTILNAIDEDTDSEDSLELYKDSCLDDIIMADTGNDKQQQQYFQYSSAPYDNNNDIYNKCDLINMIATSVTTSCCHTQIEFPVANMKGLNGKSNLGKATTYKFQVADKNLTIYSNPTQNSLVNIRFNNKTALTEPSDMIINRNHKNPIEIEIEHSKLRPFFTTFVSYPKFSTTMSYGFDTIVKHSINRHDDKIYGIFENTMIFHSVFKSSSISNGIHIYIITRPNSATCKKHSDHRIIKAYADTALDLINSNSIFESNDGEFGDIDFV